MHLTVGNLLESAAIVPCLAGTTEAVAQMNALHCERVYLTDENGLVSSVICDYTLLKAHIRGELSVTPLCQLAAPLQDILTPSQPLEEAAVLFRSCGKTEIPVFENHQFLGVLRRHRLVTALLDAESLNPAQSLQNRINAGGQPSVVSALTGMLNRHSFKTG